MTPLTINTSRFGPLTIDEKDIIVFYKGIPGFPQLRRFIYLDRGAEDGPFGWLQALDDAEVAFIVIDPLVLQPQYQVAATVEMVADLDITQSEQVQVLAIVTLTDDLATATANLRAPLLINVDKRLGQQLVLEDALPVRHPIFGAQDTQQGVE